MKKILFSSLLLFQLGALSACGVHPLPEDVTGLDTNAIVLQIRCEARDGLKNAFLAFILSPHANFPFPETTLNEARKLANGEITFAQFSPAHLDPISRFYLAKYEQAAIGYDFQFDMTVANGASFGTDFIGVVPHQIVNANAGGSVALSRQTIRNFRITDTFGGLRRLSLCDKEETRKFENYAYPVSGRIGLDELVKTFVDLNEFNNLAPGKDKEATAPVLADTFAFNTTFSASVGANVNLAPETPRFHLARAGGGASGSRQDVHKVVVAMSLDPKTTPKFEGGTNSFVGENSSYAGFNKSNAEKRTLVEIDYQKTLNSLNNIALRPNF